MSSIKYGTYTFPDPTPFVSESVEPVYLSGVYDHKLVSVDLIGNLTGSSLESLNIQKDNMVQALLSAYEDLEIDGGAKTYTKAKVANIEFSESDLTTILPYSVSIEAYEKEVFSELFGIADPKNNWSFQETDEKKLQATHDISAVGVKVDAQDPFETAKDFVLSLTGVNNIPQTLWHHLNDGENGDFILRSKKETINKKKSSYALTETYEADLNPVSDSAIVNYTVTLDIDKFGGIQASVNGNARGNIDDTLIVIDDVFSASYATELLISEIENSKSNIEGDWYSFIREGPRTYNYDINEKANTINFTYNFFDADNLDQIGNVGHKHQSSVSVGKDNNLPQVSVQGELFYNSVQSYVEKGDYEDSVRFSQIDAAFSSLNIYSLAQSALDDFKQASSLLKNNKPLTEIPRTLNVTKDPVSNIISYNYTYDTKDASNTQINITDKTPISLTNVVETINGFASQDIHSLTIGEYTVSASAEVTGDGATDKTDLELKISQYEPDDPKIESANEIQTSNKNISISKTFFYE